MKIIVTGGCGFIGSEFVRQQNSKDIYVVDKITYCADTDRVANTNSKVYKADISNYSRMKELFKRINPDIVIHFAAETHVDRSIESIKPFINTNIIGTNNLIELSKIFKVSRFIHISTDEVYGHSTKGYFKEIDPVNPRNPYSATKASAEFLIKAAINTYNFPAIIIRPTNNYGHYQYEEKLVPKVINNALVGEIVPVYGKGEQVREWLHVSDCAKAIKIILDKGKIGETYNIGSSYEQTNLETVRKILKHLNKPERLIRFVKDRPGHDFRYSVDWKKLSRLGWKPEISFDEGIKQTIKYYEKDLHNKINMLYFN